jgi:hypothetical protein
VYKCTIIKKIIIKFIFKIYYLFLFLFSCCFIEIFNRFTENNKVDRQGLSIKRNTNPRNMIKKKIKTERFMIYFLLNQFEAPSFTGFAVLILFSLLKLNYLSKQFFGNYDIFAHFPQNYIFISFV